MYIDPNWRILTVGDGDLSFSHALKVRFPDVQLSASIYDSLSVLDSKYGSDNYHWLSDSGIKVFSNVDVSKPESLKVLGHQAFDLVIFQFPLINGFPSQKAYLNAVNEYSTNTLNRKLIYDFLTSARRYFLDSSGAQLCYITSKDVKPYTDWNIENIVDADEKLEFIGSQMFDINQFPGYRIRNVDKDNFVKDTNGVTYVWSANLSSQRQLHLNSSPKHKENYCPLCGDGPYYSDQSRIQHQHSKAHQRREKYEKQWLRLMTEKQ